MQPIIEVNNLSKQYRLGTVGTGSLTHDVNRWWHRVRGKEDPYLKIGETNDRSTKGESEYVWALRDINFTVMPGDVLGIIGRNGAGKSTLLKILSRITTPTTGSVRLRGRVASLLEVGTGMHPELTGRENIYLNGTILGMRKKEIDRKLDEIVDFSGVERYVDTPVKRYSSGMHVRLGFAVAAHLEPEILIVDEVLAVGDADFQKKCIGKMKDVSKGEGRTILFVSHNMTAVKNLCQKAILLKDGMLSQMGEINEIVQEYEKSESLVRSCIKYDNPSNAPGNERVRLKKFEISSGNGNETIYVDTEVRIDFEFWNYEIKVPINLSMHVFNHLHECVFNLGTKSSILTEGLHKGTCIIPARFLNDNLYNITMLVVGDQSYAIYYFDDPITFQVLEKRDPSGWHGKHLGYVRPQFPFTIEPVSND